MRLGCFLLATLLLLPFPFWIDSSRIFVQASSFVTICTILAGGTIWVGSILGLVFAAISLVRKRWFCRYICPVGLLLDTVSGRNCQAGSGGKAALPIGKYIVLLTAAGAILGYPLFLWMDPLAFLNNAFSVYNSNGCPVGYNFPVRHSCTSFVGIDLGRLLVRPYMPSGCHAGSSGKYRILLRKFQEDKQNRISRQKPHPEMLFRQRGGCSLQLQQAWDSACWRKKSVRQDLDDAPLRPPGAIKEDEFTGLCLRCGNCIRTCPSRIIHPDTGQSGILGFLSPVVRYETDYCNEECNACTTVCPSGALQSIEPGAEKQVCHRKGQCGHRPVFVGR